MTTYRRRSARVILIDPANRILLMHMRIREGGSCWLTPGGGVDRGESLRDAAARELREETGIVTAADTLAGPVAATEGYAAFSWAKGVFRDDFFVHRTSVTEVAATALEAYETELSLGHRWWTVAELARTTETVHPLGLAELLTDLLNGGVAGQPRRLPWHH